jgi:hypothetical protein
MSEVNNMEHDGSVAVGPGGSAPRGSGPTVSPAAPTGSRSDAVTVQAGSGGNNTTGQVTFNYIFNNPKNAESVCSGGTGIELGRENAVGDTAPKNLESSIISNCSREDDDSIVNDVSFIGSESFSLLDRTDDNRNIDLADLTVVDQNFSTCSLNDSYIQENVVGKEPEKEKDNSEPKQKRLSNSERRFAKKLRRDEERGREAREANKGKPMTDLQVKVNKEIKSKISYAEATKTKHVMLEVRADDYNVTLEQEDFNTIDRELIFRYADMTLDDKEPDEDELDDDNELADDGINTSAIRAVIHDSDEEDVADKDTDKYFCGYIGGLSQGACWFACDNKETEVFIKTQVPTIVPPNSGKYKYVVYDASKKPFRYMKAKIPARLWSTKKRLTSLFSLFNECLRIPLPNHKGIMKNIHFKIVAGCTDYESEIKEGKYFWIQIEMDERMISKLTDPIMKGCLKIGASPIQLFGGGIVSETKEKLTKKLTAEANQVIDSDTRG